LSKTLGRFRILDKAEQQKLRDANKVTKRDLREAGKGVSSKISMAAPLQRSLISLPSELLELVCSFLNARDIANVGALCRQLRTRLREGRVWKALAERFTLRLRLPVCTALVQYAKKHNLERKHYKIIIGIAAELQRSVSELREASQKYGEARRDEETKYRTHKLLGVNQTGRGFNLWLKNIMKVSMQEKLMDAKVDQLLHHREELHLEETLPNSQLDDTRLGDFFLGSSDSEESVFVSTQIMKYVGWLRRTVQPTDSEVEMGLRLKSPSILESIRHIIEAEEPEQD